MKFPFCLSIQHCKSSQVAPGVSLSLWESLNIYVLRIVQVFRKTYNPVLTRHIFSHTLQGGTDIYWLKIYNLCCIWLFLNQSIAENVAQLFTPLMLFELRSEGKSDRDGNRVRETDLLTGNVVLLLSERVQVLDRSNYGCFLADSKKIQKTKLFFGWSLKMDSLWFRAQFFPSFAVWGLLNCMHV